MIEIERRFLVDRLPDELPEPVQVEQAYISTVPVSVRARLIGDRRVLTIKSGQGLERMEIEHDLTPEEFDALWRLPNELRISKRRHRIDLGNGLTAELDLFDGALTGRRLVEVEFDSVDAAHAFTPPAWFGREVTDDGRYTNGALARHGWPDEPPNG
jgi:CYTH domain-containing protein